MGRRKLLKRLVEGNLRNVSFADLLSLAQGFGFRPERISGSHHVLSHPALPELLSLQEVKGEGKPYQIRQFLRMVERYDLILEG